MEEQKMQQDTSDMKSDVKSDTMDAQDSGQEPKSGSGALVGIIIIIIVLVLGGFYFFGSTSPDEDGDEVVDSQTEELLELSDSDEVDDIQRDLDNTGLDGLDEELGDIDSLLEE